MLCYNYVLCIMYHVLFVICIYIPINCIAFGIKYYKAVWWWIINRFRSSLWVRVIMFNSTFIIFNTFRMFIVTNTISNGDFHYRINSPSNYLNPTPFHWSACTKLGKCTVGYMCYRDVAFSSVLTICRSDNGIVRTVWYSLLFIVIA